MTKPRILFVNMRVPSGDADSPQYTGEWRDGYELAIALAQGGADVTLLSPAIGKHAALVRNEIDPVAIAAGVKLHYANFVLNRQIGSYMTVRLTIAWVRAYPKLKPDLIIFKQARPDFGLLIPGVRDKTLVLTTDLGAEATPSATPRENSALIYRQPTPVERVVDKLCYWLLWSMAAWRPVEKQYRWTGLLIQSASQGSEPTPPANAKYQNVVPMRKGFLQYPENAWQADDHLASAEVVFCGAIGLRKGIFELLEAWRKVQSAATLAIVGIGPPDMQKQLQETLATLSRIRYWESLGYFKKFALLEKAKVFVLPSKYDHYPSVIFEALAVGLPVVTTRQVLSPIRHGENGLLVDAEDINGLAQAIDYLLTHEDERQRMAACARQTITDYSWDNAVEQILALATATKRPL